MKPIMTVVHRGFLRMWRQLLSGFLLAASVCHVAGHDTLSHSGGPLFVENRGQWEDCVRFKSEYRGGALFFERDAVTFVMQNREQVEEIMGRKFSGPSQEPGRRMVDMYAYRVRFAGCLPDVRVRGLGQHREYHNYYLGNDPKRWAAGVPLFDTLCYEQLYKGVDLLYYLEKSSYKYAFRVAPHASPEQISMRYEGADRVSVRSGNVVVRVGDREAVELRPYAYQPTPDGGRQEVECRYERKGTSVRFRLGAYDRSLPLVIDPVMVFCSYTGSFADNWGYTATYDRHGNMYGGGSVFSNGYPVTLGAYQMDYGGGSCDIAIMKFSSKGDSVLFSTFLGGRKSEVPHSLVVNDNDELYLLASTSSRDFPVTTHAYDTLFSWSTPPDTFVLTNVIYYLGGIDIAVSKFSADGRQLLASTYFGGSGPDGLATDVSLRKNYADEVRGEIMVDAYSNVYIVSSTASPNLPVSATAFQKKYGGGGQDGCIAKFSYDLRHLIWCSYIGGDSADAAYSMVLDNDNNIYVCGGTRSRNLPVTRGVLQTSYGGGESDGYIAWISTNGNQIKALTYFGKGGYDQAYLIKMDQSDYVYVMGLTDASGNAWIYNAKWSVSGGGQVIAKMNHGLDKLVWSTAFGTGRKGPDLSPTALMVDLCHQVYFSGWGSPSVNAHVGNTQCGTRGLPISSDAMRFITDNNDFYFLSLNADASNVIYGTFFGGSRSAEHVDGGTSRFDRKGVIYQAICASCGGNNDLPVTSGVVGPRNNSMNCNLGVVKIDFNIREVVADFSIPNVICAPDTIHCKNTSRMVDSVTTSYFWDFGDGTSSTEKSPKHEYRRSGTYRVRLVVSDSASCNLHDTLDRDRVVLSSTFDTLPDNSICKGDFIQIGLQPASSSNITYQWYPSDGLSSTIISNPIASDTVSRTYYLLISDGVCTDTLRVRVKVSTVSLEMGPDVTLCAGDSLRLKPKSSEAQEYHWSTSPNFYFDLNDDPSNPELMLDAWFEGTYYLRASTGKCVLLDSVRVSSSLLEVELPADRRICFGDTLCVAANVRQQGEAGLCWFTWEDSPGEILSGAHSDSICLVAEASGPLSLLVVSEFGCSSRDTMYITVDSLIVETKVTPVRCHGERNGEILVRTFSGQPPFRYIWTPAVGSGAHLTGLAPGSYRLRLEDAAGCAAEKEIVVSEPAPLAATVTDSQTLVPCGIRCIGFLEMSVNGGVPPYRYGWFHGDTSLRADSLCPGTYRFFVEDAYQCTDTVTVEIRDTSDMKAQAQVTDILCHGRCDGAIQITASGVPPLQYHWLTGQTQAELKGLCAGVYGVVVTDARYCRRSLFPEVSEPDSLLMDSVDCIPPLCYGQQNGQITVWMKGGRPPYLYIWNGQQGSQTCSGLASGNHRLRCVDANGCVFDTTLFLKQQDSLEGELKVSKVPCKEICTAEATAFISGGTPPYSYHWSSGDSTASVRGLCYGEGLLEVTDANGCQYSISFFVDDSNTFPTPVQAWADRYLIYANETVDLYATELGPGFTYRWSPADFLTPAQGTHVKAVPEDTTTFTVTVEDIFGCRQSDTVRIRVIHIYCEHPYVFVPNTFSPNGDGVNDVLYVRGDWVESLHFAIYDRWGEKMFETDNQLRGWDGTYRGKPCEQGVYVYYLEVHCKGQTKNLLKGNVTLVR